MHPVAALVSAARMGLAELDHQTKCESTPTSEGLRTTILHAEDWLAREKERCERVEEECYQKGRHDGLAAGRAEGVKALEAVQAEACSGWGFDVVDRVRSLIDAQLAALGKKE